MFSGHSEAGAPKSQEARKRDNQNKYIQSTVANVEKYFGEFCGLFAAYVRKTARLRDKSDLLVKEIRTYAETETPNVKSGLVNFADQLATVQDYRQAQVERLEAKVIEPFKKYGNITKLKREELKVSLAAGKREAKQTAQVERIRQRNPSDRQIITQAESDLQRVTVDATRIARQLEETMDDFEKHKIKDIKKIFGDFITIEMAFHAKALEVYTTAYQHVQNIDEDEDMEAYRSSLHFETTQPRLSLVSANFLKSTNGNNSSISMLRSSKENTPGSTCKLQLDDEEEEDDDGIEEEEEDEEEEEEYVPKNT